MLNNFVHPSYIYLISTKSRSPQVNLIVSPLFDKKYCDFPVKCTAYKQKLDIRPNTHGTTFHPILLKAISFRGKMYNY